MENEFNNQTTQLKVTIPDYLLKELDEFSKHFSKSRSEVVRDSIQKFISEDEIGQSKRYFFKKAEGVPPKKEQVIKALSSAKKGTLIKVALSMNDNPSSAQIFIGSLVMFSGNTVSFEVPQNFRNTALIENITGDQQNISLNKDNAKLVFPRLQNIVNSIISPYPYNSYIYELPIEYIWDIDTAQPQWVLPSPAF